jgi:hypothetical protein
VSRPSVSLALLVVAYALAVLAGFWIWPGKYDAISAWAVILTGGVILWYTWETMQLRRAAHAQRELHIRPFVVITRVVQGFRLRNLGPGTALNVRVGDVVVDEQEQLVIHFPAVVSLLPAGEERDITAESFHKDKNAGDFFAAHLDPKYAVMELQVDVTYDNIEMKNYCVSEKVEPGGLTILGVREI